jgi:Tfp pilus assembly protein PilW
MPEGRRTASTHPAFTGPSRQAGTSLIEALIAMAIAIAALGAAGQLFIWSRREGWSAAARTAAVSLAQQKLEFLRSLEWHADENGLPLSDEISDTSSDQAARGGSGLQPSPPGTLTEDTDGFVDYIGTNGSHTAASGAGGEHVAFVRRWAIEPFGSDPAHTLLLTVIVAPVLDLETASSSRVARLTIVRTRVMK